MPLESEQALDESTHRKVESAFDEIQRAARNIEREALATEAEGGEQRLADLLRSVSADLREKLKETMATAYYRPQSDEDRIAQEARKLEIRTEAGGSSEDEQVSLFDEPGEDAIAA